MYDNKNISIIICNIWQKNFLLFLCAQYFVHFMVTLRACCMHITRVHANGKALINWKKTGLRFIFSVAWSFVYFKFGVSVNPLLKNVYLSDSKIQNDCLLRCLCMQICSQWIDFTFHFNRRIVMMKMTKMMIHYLTGTSVSFFLFNQIFELQNTKKKKKKRI